MSENLGPRQAMIWAMKTGKGEVKMQEINQRRERM